MCKDVIKIISLDDDVIKIKFVNQQEEEIVEDSCKKDDKKDKCEKDDKKCLVMKCPECDYEGEFDMDEEGNYVCPECGFKLEPDKEEEPDIDRMPQTLIQLLLPCRGKPP